MWIVLCPNTHTHTHTHSLSLSLCLCLSLSLSLSVSLCLSVSLSLFVCLSLSLIEQSSEACRTKYLHILCYGFPAISLASSVLFHFNNWYWPSVPELRPGVYAVRALSGLKGLEVLTILTDSVKFPVSGVTS